MSSTENEIRPAFCLNALEANCNLPTCRICAAIRANARSGRIQTPIDVASHSEWLRLHGDPWSTPEAPIGCGSTPAIQPIPFPVDVPQAQAPTEPDSLEAPVLVPPINEDMCLCADCDFHYHYQTLETVYAEGISRLVCAYCLENYQECEDTGRRVLRDDVYCYDDDDGDVEYFEHYESYLRYRRVRVDPDQDDMLLHSYSTRVQQILGHKAYIGTKEVTLADSRALLMGVELETSRGEADSAYALAEALCNDGKDFSTYAICKVDGTVTGPEIVSVPADLAAHRALIPWADWCRVLRQNGGRGYHSDGTGIHVHVNRAPISALTLGKIMVFVNAPDHREFIEAIAQRAETVFCKKLEKKLSDGRLQKPNKSRYEAINVTMATVEFRIFRSNLISDRIYKNLEFCESLVRFCQTRSARYLNPSAYLEFLDQRAGEYKILLDFVNANKLERTIRPSPGAYVAPIFPEESDECA